MTNYSAYDFCQSHQPPLVIPRRGDAGYFELPWTGWCRLLLFCDKPMTFSLPRVSVPPLRGRIGGGLMAVSKVTCSFPWGRLGWICGQVGAKIGMRTNLFLPFRGGQERLWFYPLYTATVFASTLPFASLVSTTSPGESWQLSVTALPLSVVIEYPRLSSSWGSRAARR